MNVIFATSCNCLCFRLHSMKKVTFFSKGIRDSTYSPRNNLFFFSKSKRKSKMHHFIMAMSKLLFCILFSVWHLSFAFINLFYVMIMWNATQLAIKISFSRQLMCSQINGQDLHSCKSTNKIICVLTI